MIDNTMIAFPGRAAFDIAAEAQVSFQGSCGSGWTSLKVSELTNLRRARPISLLRSPDITLRTVRLGPQGLRLTPIKLR